MNRFSILFALLSFMLLGVQPVLAQETFSFQGRLTTPEGTSVADGSYSVRFQLFDDETGGSPQWGEAHAVTTQDGVFSVVLGTKTTLNLNVFSETPYLLLIVENEAMEPRVPLTAVPYAMKSYRLDEEALVAGDNVSITRRSDGSLRIGATGGGGGGGLTSVATDATMAGNGTSANPLGLADGSVTGAKLSNNALLAGANVDIVRRGNGSLEISATGGGGGLTQVASDATLVGEGTTGSPLAVQVPLVLTNPGNGTVLEAHNGTGTLGHLGGSESGAYGESSQGHRGLLGGEFSGVFGLHSSGNTGELGSSSYGAYGFSNTNAGVYGAHNNGTIGMLGSGNHGVYGEHGNGHFGLLGANGLGILGAHSSGNLGMLGSSEYGAYGQHSNSNYGYLGGSDYGVYGESSDGSIGILGGGAGAGVYGSHASNGNWGELGGGTYAVMGHHGNGNTGVLGGSTYGVYGEGSSSGDAGGFLGDVIILGNLAKSSGSFKIDHPLDPANKYLSHSFVESPDMKNVYDGNATLDANGEAVVTLPDYFEALNRDFRYQLTCMGGFAPVYIAEEIAGNTFKIAGGTPGMKVSWQVTGIRQDAWAEEHRIVVEEDKPAEERGFYLHPRLFGQSEEHGLMWARDPDLMRALQATPVRPHVERPQQVVEQTRQEAARVQRERERLRTPEHQ